MEDEPEREQHLPGHDAQHHGVPEPQNGGEAAGRDEISSTLQALYLLHCGETVRP